jgi:hypothetical protein
MLGFQALQISQKRQESRQANLLSKRNESNPRLQEAPLRSHHRTLLNARAVAFRSLLPKPDDTWRFAPLTFWIRKGGDRATATWFSHKRADFGGLVSQAHEWTHPETARFVLVAKTKYAAVGATS